MVPAELLRDAVGRRAVSGHEGKSRAGLERVRTADGNDLMGPACRGREICTDPVPPDVSGPVLELLDDVSPLAAALGTGPVTSCVGPRRTA